MRGHITSSHVETIEFKRLLSRCFPARGFYGPSTVGRKGGGGGCSLPGPMQDVSYLSYRPRHAPYSSWCRMHPQLPDECYVYITAHSVLRVGVTATTQHCCALCRCSTMISSHVWYSSTEIRNKYDMCYGTCD